MKTFKMYWIRHGLTRANEEGIYAGSGTDLPLSDDGLAHLDRLQQDFEYPRVPLVFVSPLLRAKQTADELFPGVHQIVIDDLREIGLGEFEGKTVDEVQKMPRFRDWLDPKQRFTPEGGESGDAFARRAGGVFVKISEYMIRSATDEAAVVTHGGLIMTALAMHAVPKRPPDKWACDPGCGFALQTTAASFMRDQSAEALDLVPFGYSEYCAHRQSENG